MKNLIVPALCVVAISFGSCKKEDSVTNPISDSTSTALTAGNNANVLSSSWESSGSWASADSVQTGVFELSMTPVQLENNGILRVFLSHSGDASSVALPATVDGFEYYYVAAGNKLSIYARPVEATASANPPEWQVKNVFINGKTIDSAKTNNISIGKLMNYSLNELTDLTFEEPSTGSSNN